MRKRSGTGLKLPIDYRVLISSRYDDRKKKYLTRVVLRTIKEFSNFQYQIVVAADLKEQTLRLAVQGLRSPKTTFPGSGPALYETEYPDLCGQYEVIVSKANRWENKFSVKISKGNVEISKSPARKFVDIVTDESLFYA